MKTTSVAIAILTSCILMFSGCMHGVPGLVEPDVVGPRTQEAWKEWGERQEALRETWGDTEVYVYVRTIMEDLEAVNASVVFGDGFSTEEQSVELDALRRLCDDANLGEDISMGEFIERLGDSPLRHATGTMLDLDSIEERQVDGGVEYDVTLLYYPTPDALMPVSMTVGLGEDGAFSLEGTFLPAQGE